MLKEDELYTLKTLHNPIWVYDIERFRIHWANDQAMAFWEAESEEELYSRDFRENMSEAIVELLKNDLSKFRSGQQHTQWWTLFPRGKRKEVYCHYSGIHLNDDRIAMLAQVVVTKELLETELSVHSSTTIASLWDSSGRLKSANPMFHDLYGDHITQFNQLFFSERQAQELWAQVIATKEIETEIYLPTPLGDQWHNVLIRANQSQDGNVIVLRQYDVTERKQSELHHRHLAVMDPLTQLYNRYGILQKLEELAAGLPGFSLLFIDLDNFKTINDYYGHAQGDRLLKAIAERMRHRFAQALSIGRLGGDEFLLVLPKEDSTALEQAANKVVSTLAEPFYLDGLGELRTSGSVGVARFPDDGETIDEILRFSDAAMYQAKHRGKGTHVHFSKKISDELSRRQQIRQLLSKAVTQNELAIRYAPILDTRTQQTMIYDAVVTWQSPELGAVGAAEFMPIAEESGLASLLGYYVLERTTRELVKRRHETQTPVRSLVSLSAQQLLNPGFQASIQKLLALTQCPADALLLSIDETRMSPDIKMAAQALTALRNEGISIVMGGFGSGGSSLSLLHKLPVTHLRLDASIIEELEEGTLPVAQAALSMARSMHLDVIAMGVDSQMKVEVLKDIGCYLCEGDWLETSASE